MNTRLLSGFPTEETTDKRKLKISNVRLPIFGFFLLQQIRVLMSGFRSHTPHEVRSNKELYNYLIKGITNVIPYYYLLSTPVFCLLLSGCYIYKTPYITKHFFRSIVRYLQVSILTVQYPIVRFYKINNLTIKRGWVCGYSR